MLKIKIVREDVQMKYGTHNIYTMWCKEKEDEDWYFMALKDEPYKIFYAEWLSKELNGWSFEWANKIKKHSESQYCSCCNDEHTTTEIRIDFDNKNFPSINQYYCDHFGTGTSDEELIEQFNKVGIELSIEYED